MPEQDAHQHPEPKPIHPPDNFPVTWEDPDDTRLPWQFDSVHFPSPCQCLEAELWIAAFNIGWNGANEVFGVPVRAKAAHINTYLYQAIFPVVEPEAMGEAMGKAEETLNGYVDRLDEVWKGEWLPEIQAHLEFWDAFDLQGANMDGLTAHLDETFERTARLWEIHFQTVFPVYIAISQFDDLYRDLFESEGAFDAYRLLQGFPNETLNTDRALWVLSRQALEIPGVKGAIESHASGEIPAALEAFPAGQAFLAEFQQFLQARGQRGTGWSMALESWIEDPVPALHSLKDYLAQPDRDMDAEQEALAAERDRGVGEARERLQGYPQQVVEEFERLLKAAQTGVVLTEDHGFWIDFSAMYRVRRVIMEVGRRFVEAGRMDAPGDLFYLTREEVRGASADESDSDLRGLVAERRGEIQHFDTVAPPQFLGTDYGPPPDNFITRVMGKFFGVPPVPSDNPDVLTGNAGSRGKVQGIARVLKSPLEGDKLNAGDVLVAQTTAPPWTPLFATAGAIVTNSGGVLSHCAVVAREYGIPAVVGTQRATEVIQDGQLVEVDGDAGIVRIVSTD